MLYTVVDAACLHNSPPRRHTAIKPILIIGLVLKDIFFATLDLISSLTGSITFLLALRTSLSNLVYPLSQTEKCHA